MSEKLPYEEQLNHTWDELPLPDEDTAWKDMKRRLDEDDDDKIVAPPPKSGCGIGALLIGLLLAGGLWLLLRPEKWFIKKETETTQQTKEDNKKPGADNSPKETIIEKTNPTGQKENKTGIAEDTALTVRADDNTNKSNSINKKEHETNGDSKIDALDANSIKSKKKLQSLGETNKTARPVSKVNKAKTKLKIDKETRQKEKNISVSKTIADTIVENKTDIAGKENNSTGIKPDTTLKQADTKTIKPVDSIAAKKPTVATNKTNPAIEKKKDKQAVFFSAGIGLHQQIPISGQEWTTYGSLGRKGILSDYIPSINFRMEKEKRWFLQSEFRYGAPQHTKQVTYSQKISIDTQTQVVTTNSSVLKKTFYHQVPVTFNYYVLPGWSVGAGVQWNKFYSAVAEQDLKKRIPGTAIDSVISKNIVKVSNDSSTALVKSWWQGVVQTQYQWKRFSIGARYSFGLQPYIKFRLPNQPLQEEKNNSLQIFLRYELWRSKK